jgi:hypothetical protein
MLLAVEFAETKMSTMPGSIFRTRRKILPPGPLLIWANQRCNLRPLRAFVGEEKAGMPFA